MALFFSQRKPRGFNYKPRFYDPQTEAFRERKKIDFTSARRSRRRKQRSTIILVGMLVLIGLIVWMLYFK